MIRKYLLFLYFIPLIITAQGPLGYYLGTENLSGYELKSKLHDIISTKTYNYHYDDLKSLYGKTDIDKFYDFESDNLDFILDIYSYNPIVSTLYHYTINDIVGSANAEGQGWNREHMMPQSTFKGTYPMFSDLFFVIPTDARINQLRSNYPYGIAGYTVYHNFSNGSKLASNGTPNTSYKGRVYEPIDEFKGDIARTLLYFSVRYEGKLNGFNYTTNISDPSKDQNPLDGSEEKAYEDWYIDMLLDWHRKDPVSQREIERNNSVYQIQKNRNPFIDHPEWVEAIWNQKPNNTAPNVPTSLKLERNSAYFVNLIWDPKTDNNTLGYKIYQNNELVAVSKKNCVTIDHLSPSSSYNFTVRAYNNNYLESPESNIFYVTTLGTDVFAKDLQIIKYLEGGEKNKAIEIVNKTGKTVNLNKYKIAIQFKASNFYFGKPTELEGEIKNNESFVIINMDADFNCFDNSNAKFITNAPALTFSGSNYIELSYKSKTVDAIGFKGQDNTNARKSLYRNSNIMNPNAFFNINEWTTYPSNYCLNLGHLVTNDVENNNLKYRIYPNPVDDILNIYGDFKSAKSAKILDLSGKLLISIKNPFINYNHINVNPLPSNVYILNIDGKLIKFIKK